MIDHHTPDETESRIPVYDITSHVLCNASFFGNPSHLLKYNVSYLDHRLMKYATLGS